MKSHIFNTPNKFIEIKDFDSTGFRIILDDIHSFLKVPKKKRDSAERCRGRSLIEPAMFESYKHWDNPWAISNANLKRSMSILDCGSGRGVLQFYLASKGLNVYSIDVGTLRSKSVIKIIEILKTAGIKFKLDPLKVHRKLNRKYNLNVNFKRESADNMSFREDFFDRIFCISVIEHMPDNIIKDSMKEMERILKPGGLLLLTFDFHPESDKDIIGFTESDFRSKVLDQCGLKIVNNEPEFMIENWKEYIKEINAYFKTENPNTSYGIVLRKEQ